MKCRIPLALLVALLLPALPARAARVNLAVFNFQMKSNTPEWRWLEKGLADRVITDLFANKSVSVVQRETMQQLAERMRWVPEMLADPQRLEEIRKALKIDYLVSGVYEVRDGRLTITTVVVDFRTKKEVARKEISGRPDEALALGRKLSAWLLSWLTHRPAEKILGELPVWTRSVPAARALYQGVDLYDQGRYAEAWLEFRRSHGSEPDNVEAQYWVGRMYYFLARCRHARLAMERFVRENPAHPRVLDALWVYQHAAEAEDLGLDERVRICRQVQQRYETIYKREGWARAKGVSEALQAKLAHLFDLSGRHREALLTAGPAIRGDRIRNGLSALNLTAHHALTGETFPPELTTFGWRYSYSGITLRFPEGRNSITLRVGKRILGKDHQHVDRRAAFEDTVTDKTMFLAAPSGHVFRSLQLEPKVSGGDDAIMEVSLGRVDDSELFFDSQRVPLAEACSRRVTWLRLPSTGLLRLKWAIRVRDKRTSPPVTVNSVIVITRQEKLSQHGAAYVTCNDTPNFVAEVDGIYARAHPGLVGPLGPGPHQLTLRPIHPEAPYESWSTRFVVTPGRTNRVTGRLPFRAASGWAAWRATCVQRDRLGYQPRAGVPAPEILIEPDTVRLVWAFRDDLWTSASRGGDAFAAPCKIGLPVSSAWGEHLPRCVRLESGRYLLVFRSYRRGGRRSLYASWSRDFRHWSSPVRLALRGPSAPGYDLCQDARGRLLLAVGEPTQIVLYRSYDGLTYTKLDSIPLTWQGLSTHLTLVQRGDQSFELFLRQIVTPGKDGERACRLLRYTSRSGTAWGRPEVLCTTRLYGTLSAVHCAGRTTIAVSSRPERSLTGRLFFVVEQPDGTYLRSKDHLGVTSGGAALARHPQQGWLLAWGLGCGDEWVPHEPAGPYVLRGPGAKGLMGSDPTPLAAAKQRPRAAAGRTRRKARPASRPAGKLRLVPVDSARSNVRLPTLVARRPGDFSSPKRGSGAHPSAVVATLRAPGRVIQAAIDSRQPEAKNPDVLRIDLTGKGDFTNAYVVPLHNRLPYLGKLGSQFLDEKAALNIDGRKIPVNFRALYLWDDGSHYLHIRFGWMAVGRCRIGSRDYEIRCLDADGNFRLHDPARLVVHDGRAVGYEGGDRIQVDLDNGQFRDFATFLTGRLVGLDGGLYRLELSDDLKSIAAKPYEGQTGALQAPHAHWAAKLLAPDRLIAIRGNRKPIPVPPGRYVLSEFTEYSDSVTWGDRAEFTVNDTQGPRQQRRVVNVVPGRTLQLKAGSPITAALRIKKSGDAVLFDLVQRDVAGGRIDKMILWGRSGRTKPKELTVEIFDSSGKSVEKLAMSFCVRAHTVTWRPPAGLRGRFQAKLRYSNDAFGKIRIEPPQEFVLP